MPPIPGRPLPNRYRLESLDCAGHGGRAAKVLSSRWHGEAPANAPGGLRGPHRFWALAGDVAEEGPDAAGVSCDASDAHSPAGQARDAPVGRRPRGAGPAELETGALR